MIAESGRLSLQAATSNIANWRFITYIQFVAHKDLNANSRDLLRKYHRNCRQVCYNGSPKLLILTDPTENWDHSQIVFIPKEEDGDLNRGVIMKTTMMIFVALIVLFPTFATNEEIKKEVNFFLANYNKNAPGYRILIFKQHGVFVGEILTDQQGKSSTSLEVGKYYFVVSGDGETFTKDNYYIGNSRTKEVITLEAPSKSWFLKIFTKEFIDMLKGVFVTISVGLLFFWAKYIRFRRIMKNVFFKEINKELKKMISCLDSFTNSKEVFAISEANTLYDNIVKNLEASKIEIQNTEAKCSNYLFEYSIEITKRLFLYKEIIEEVANELDLIINIGKRERLEEIQDQLQNRNGRLATQLNRARKLIE